MDPARVLVVDADGQVLLLRTVGAAGHVWSLPSVPEVQQELGLPTPDLRAHSAGFLLLRRPRQSVNTADATDLERARHHGHRWWSVSDLQYTTETVHPAGLAGLLGDVLGE